MFEMAEEECEDHYNMTKPIYKRYKRYESIGQRERAKRVSRGYECRMAINRALSGINPDAELEGRISKKNGDLTIDLSLAKRSKSSGPLSKLGFLGGNNRKQCTEEKGRIIQKIDYLENELDAVARKIRREIRKKTLKNNSNIRGKDRKENKSKSWDGNCVEVLQCDNSEGERQSCSEDFVDNDCQQSGDETDQAKLKKGKYKEDTMTVRREKMICDGVEEFVVITTKEHVHGRPNKQIKVVTTTEKHTRAQGGGYTVKRTEKIVKDDKHNSFITKKKEIVKEHPQKHSSSADKEACQRHMEREATTEIITDAEGKKLEVKVDKQEKTKHNRTITKTTTEVKDVANGGNAFYEKTVKRSQHPN